MIFLLQPPRQHRRISGGYRYNSELGKRLQAERRGRVVDIPAERLARELPVLAEDHPGCVLVLDSLYIGASEPPEVLANLDGSVETRLLLHYLPSQNPRLSEDERERTAAREAAWIHAVDGVIATSFHTAAAIRGLREAEVARPGMESLFQHAPATRSPSEILTVIAIANLMPEKGQEEVARAVASSGVESARLVLIGDDSLDPEYTRAVEKAAHGIDLEHKGILEPEEVSRELRSADLFVSASAYESYGMATAEAVALGVPVVTYRTGEADHWIQDGENGYLVEPLRFEDLAKRVSQLLKDPVRLRSLPTCPPPAFPTWDDTFLHFVSASQKPRRSHSGPDRSESGVRLYSHCDLPTAHGVFRVDVYRAESEGESLLISMGDLSHGPPPFVRVHSECFTGEVLHSLKCDCREQLLMAMQIIGERRRGAIVYLRQEGRGIGLGNKILAYAEQAKGADTVEANHILGFPTDLRDFSTAAAILKEKQAMRIELNTNNPDKIESLKAHGIIIERVRASTSETNPHNVDYLKTKFQSLGHLGLASSLAPPDETPEK